MNEHEKSKKYARLVFKNVSLGRVLDKLRKHYEAENQPKSLVIPYVLTCAAYLESKLNDSLLHVAMKRYGEDTADAFMSFSLPKKLNVFVSVLTDGRYRINKEHFIYQRLLSLIRVRNSITHAKSEFEEITTKPDDLIDVPAIHFGTGKIPRQFIDEPDITLGASKTFSPLEYHDALEKLEKWFFRRCPDKLSKIAMVIDCTKEGQWEEDAITMSKFFD
jgi:hypothetical protein